ncbi:hypothetical protein M422DRAFT_165213 [Sphaerobolus stellatus SS14]|nr:hypothetical protein M422DRAFT_165213 [Sphaerobolus stellatus SS14]
MASSLPTARAIKVDTRGAVILNEESPETRDSRGIYLPNYIEPVSHIAVDIGGSLAKIVYFTRSPEPHLGTCSTAIPINGHANGRANGTSPLLQPSTSPQGSPRAGTPPEVHLLRSGALTPLVLEHNNNVAPLDDPGLSSKLHTVKTLKHFPGGSLNFERFETSNIEDCVAFIQELISRSATVNGVSEKEMRKSVKIMATGGGAHRFYELFSESLGVEVSREDEMECLIEGLRFITHIPEEVYFFSDELIYTVSHPERTLPAQFAVDAEGNPILERPSPDPPKYSVSFAKHAIPQFPCLLVNIGSGVSIIKVDEDGNFERVSGTSLGGGTLWGLLSLLTPATTFDEMLDLAEQGDNSTVDMLVGDIYGQDYSKLGLKSTMIASTFGKVFRKGEAGQKRNFSPEDISRSLLYAISNNIGQIAFVNAEKYNLDKIYFGGCFIRGHAATVATLSYAIRFWSKGTKRALFLRHEGFLGSIGAWVKNIQS